MIQKFQNKCKIYILKNGKGFAQFLKLYKILLLNEPYLVISNFFFYYHPFHHNVINLNYKFNIVKFCYDNINKMNTKCNWNIPCFIVEFYIYLHIKKYTMNIYKQKIHNFRYYYK